MAALEVHVRPDHHGGWEVGLSDRPHAIHCDTFDEARRVALRQAQRARPCDLVIRDAYDRVREHTLIAGDDAAQPPP